MDEPKLPFRRPADYYSTPVGDAKPLFPRWVPFGCGTAAIVLLIIVFIGGIVATKYMGPLLDMMFGSMDTEITKMFTKDVTPAQKAAFENEMKAMRDQVRHNRLRVDRIQPLLKTMRDAVSDEKVTPAEAQQLTNQMHALNTAPPPPPPRK